MNYSAAALLLLAAPLARAMDTPPVAAAPIAVVPAALPVAGDAPDGPLGGELPTGAMKDDNAFYTPPVAWSPASPDAAQGGGSLNFLGSMNEGDGAWRLPVPGYVTSPYGKRRLLPVYRTRYVKARNKKGKVYTRRRRVRIGRRLHIHKGIDLKAQKGDPIHAVSGGVVNFAGQAQGYGNCVYIDHPDGLQTRYAHASRVLVSTGDVIEPGQVIALAGSTGRSTGPHLHFEVRRAGEAVNPLPYLEAARVQEEDAGEEGDSESGEGGDGDNGE